MNSRGIIRIITSGIAQIIILAFIGVFFLIGLCNEFGKLQCIVERFYTENYWNMFSGISIPLSVWVVFSKELRDKYSNEERLKKEFIHKLRLLMKELDELIIHIHGFKTVTDLSLLDSLDIKGNKKHEIIYHLVLELYKLSSFEYTLNGVERRNYVFRVTIEHILEILSQLSDSVGPTYEIKESIKNMEKATAEGGEGFMKDQTEDMYKKQYEHISKHLTLVVRDNIVEVVRVALGVKSKG